MFEGPQAFLPDQKGSNPALTPLGIE